jgi:DNA-binding GntR family transcriptional regulator
MNTPRKTTNTLESKVKTLKTRHQSVYFWVSDFICLNGHGPLMREICEGVGCSKETARAALDALQAAGLILPGPGLRGLRLTHAIEQQAESTQVLQAQLAVMQRCLVELIELIEGAPVDYDRRLRTLATAKQALRGC